jgi:hypothetical protein
MIFTVIIKAFATSVEVLQFFYEAAFRPSWQFRQRSELPIISR